MEVHDLRPECAKEFGRIHRSLEFHQEWRTEQRQSLLNIQKEVEKLTGNGNRGRIDDIFLDLAEIKTMLISHIAEATARDHRLDAHAARLDKLDSRIYTVAIGAAGLTALLIPLGKMLVEHLF